MGGAGVKRAAARSTIVDRSIGRQVRYTNERGQGSEGCADMNEAANTRERGRFARKDDAYLARRRVDVATLVDVLIVLRILQPNLSGEGHLWRTEGSCWRERGGAEEEREV